MKKLVSIILIACLAMAVITVVPVSAADDVVLRGSPVIDGEIDEIYKQSLTIVYDGDPAKNASSVADGYWLDATATFYALYDARYVYVAAEVKDDDVVSAADVYVYENNNPYGNDVVEFRFDLGGGDPWDDSTFFKIGIDAYGKNIYSPDSLGIGCDLSEVYYATTITEDGYIVEVAVPHDTRPQDDVIGAGKLGLKCWIFDLPAENAGIEAPVQGVDFFHYALSIEGEEMGDRVFYPLSDEKAVVGSDTTAKEEVTTEPEVTTREPEVTTREPEVTTREPEVTTREPEVTTREPEVTTREPEVTTEPEDTTTEPEVTTEEPEVTTEPEDTTTEPEVTTEEPEVTTEPEDTTTEPEDTTTEADDTTTEAPSASAPDTGDTDGKSSAAIPVAIAAVVIVAVAVVLAVALKKKH